MYLFKLVYLNNGAHSGSSYFQSFDVFVFYKENCKERQYTNTKIHDVVLQFGVHNQDLTYPMVVLLYDSINKLLV